MTTSARTTTTPAPNTKPLTPQQLADYLGTTIKKLAKMRHDGTGPMFVKFGRDVRYRWHDVQAWMEQQTTKGSN